jgi:hypothetical protein
VAVRIVFITWTDAVGCAAGWSDDRKLSEYNGNAYSCGFVLDEDEDWILVAGHQFADEGDVQGAVAIPKKMIDKLAELEVP